MKKEPEDLHEKYWNGTKNKIIRYYFYISKGLDLFNAFRYVFMAIFGLYLILKLKNAFWLLGMFSVSIPCLMAAGWYSIHHMGKVIDWLTTRFSSHYGLASFELQKEIRDAVQEMANKSRQTVD